ncbi:class I SAM-dependent methyltransferase [Acidimangrovimonas sediminis]|uniref:tetratricopeptide repeat protein n=1 Tax=Acidimangrovimonas sediminis TaxID=2056283 RepID=UPI000C809798|nr:tetratricopeptide repeat protein [Acidimangrovimonas sediminis]
MAGVDHVVPLILGGRTADLAEALIDLPGQALTNLPAGAIGPALDWLVEAGRTEEALVLYHSAHAVQAAVPLPVSLAHAFAAQGRHAMAIDLLAGWAEGARKRPGEYLRQAEALETLGEPGAALPVLAAAVRAYPHSGAFATHRARLLNAAGDRAAALAELDRGLDADPIQPPWVRGLRAALAGEAVTLGPLMVELPPDLLEPDMLLATLQGRHRAAARTAALATDLPGSWRLHDARAGSGVLALQIARAAPAADVTASDPDPALCGLVARNLAANGLPGAATMSGADLPPVEVLITPLGEALPAIPAPLSRLIAEPRPGLPPATLTAHLAALFELGFTLDLSGAPEVLILTRPPA